MQWNHFDGDLRSQSSNSRKRTVSKISRRRQSESTESDESAKQGSQQSGSVSLDEISAVSRSSKSRKSKIASTSKTQWLFFKIFIWLSKSTCILFDYCFKFATPKIKSWECNFYCGCAENCEYWDSLDCKTVLHCVRNFRLKNLRFISQGA